MSLVIETDYLIIGAGAVGLAFADTILNESDATVAIIDRNPQPGGHWNDAYDFVNLHQPAEYYGVNSVPLGLGRTDTEGLNKGLAELASGAEVQTYFRDVVFKHLLPTGRLRYYTSSEYTGGGRFECLFSGEMGAVKVRRKTVDATYYGTTIPLHHTPSFELSDGQTLVPPNALSREIDLNETARYCVLGSGKTAMDANIYLLEHGVNPDAITWVSPRDSWLLNRRNLQHGAAFFHDTIGMQVKQLQAIAGATSVDDLFLQMEASGFMLRVDQTETPRMYHCATVSEAELACLRQIDDVVRMGRVEKINASGMILEKGQRAMPAGTLYVDCTASAVARRPSVPIFQGDMIIPQMMRTCHPTFSSALAAHVELTVDDEARANELCGVLPLPDSVEDFVPLMLAGMMNQYQWMRDRDIRDWLINSRLDSFSNMIAGVAPEETEKVAVLSEYRETTMPAIGNLRALLDQSIATKV
jgi:hypothetical protein